MSKNDNKTRLVLNRPLYEEARLRLRYSDAQLANKAGVDARTLGRILNGETATARTVTMDAIAGALKVPTEDLWVLTSPDPAAPADADPPSKLSAAPDAAAPLYDPWTPATPPAFVGRLAELRALERAALEGRSLALVGERRMGKSSLLGTWAARATALGWPVRLLSGEGPEATGHRALVARIIDPDDAAGGPPTEPTGSDTARAPDLEAVPLSADAAADRLSAWCDAKAAAGPGPLLLLDEAEAFLQRAEPRFLERLRGLISARRLRLVLATGRELDAVYADLGRTSPFPNVLELCRLGLLDAAAARALIERGVAHWRDGNPAPALDADPTPDPDWLLDWAGPHPFYLTLLARRLLEVRGAGQPRMEALTRFRDEAEVQLRLWWATLDAPTRDLLHRAARGEAVEGFRLQRRGLCNEHNRPFGRVMTAWLRETTS